MAYEGVNCDNHIEYKEKKKLDRTELKINEKRRTRASKKTYDENIWDTRATKKKNILAPSSDQIIMYSCDRCFLVCKNKSLLNKHTTVCQKKKKDNGSSFFQNETTRKSNEDNVTGKILPLSQPLTPITKSSHKIQQTQNNENNHQEQGETERELLLSHQPKTEEDQHSQQPNPEKQEQIQIQQQGQKEQLQKEKLQLDQSVSIYEEGKQPKNHSQIEEQHRKQQETQNTQVKETKQEKSTQQQLNTDESKHFPALSIIENGTKRDYDLEYLRCQINEAYEKIIYWKKNTFEIPKGLIGKEYVKEMTMWIQRWNNNTKYRDFSIKALMLMPSLILQSTSKKAKNKENKQTIERRLAAWKEGKISELLREGITIQNRLPKSETKQGSQENLTKMFRSLMTKGNINAALRLLDNHDSKGLLPLNKETIRLLHEKHPEGKEYSDELILQGPMNYVEHVIFEEITPELIRDIALKTQGAAGPSLQNAEEWRRIIGSKIFGVESDALCKEISDMTRKLCTERLKDPESITVLMANRLIPLDKDPGLRPIGVGEILRRIISKAVTKVLKPELKNSAGSKQLCVGHQGGVEAGIHSMNLIFKEEDVHGVIQVDAENAFNTINRKVLLKNIELLCPEIAIFVFNCYTRPARMFVMGGIEISSEEGTTQGDPAAMPVYAISLIPLLDTLKERVATVKEIAFADDITGAGSLKDLKIWWDEVLEKGQYLGYFAKASKSWLIVKPSYIIEAEMIFKNSGINITQGGRKHLGGVIGSLEHKRNFIGEKVKNWISEVDKLTKIALVEPHAAYIAYTKGLKHKFTFVMRTVDGIKEMLTPLDNAIEKFLKSLFYGHEISDLELKLFSLPVNIGGLGIPMPSQICEQEYKNSRVMTEELCQQVVNQSKVVKMDERNVKVLKHRIKEDKVKLNMKHLEELKRKMNVEQNKVLEIITEKGTSNWLTAIPLKKYGFYLEKQAFRDALRIRYGIKIVNIPQKCVCGEENNMDHAFTCKRGGYVIIRHNEIRDFTAELLNEICNDVKVEPTLTPLSGETLASNVCHEEGARCDVSARGLWLRGQKTFVDIMVTNPLAKTNQKRTTKALYKSLEQRKKKKYNQRVLEVENATFTPLIFSCFGGQGVECSMFFKKVNEKLAVKRSEEESVCMTYIRTKLNFSLIRSMLLCLRGSKDLLSYKEKLDLKNVDINLATHECNLQK